MTERWKVVAMLAVIACLNYADRTAISAVFPLLKSDLGASDVQLGAVGSLFLWSYAAGSPVAGRFADVWSRSRMVFWSLTIWSAAMLVTGCVMDMNQMLVARVLLGLAECAYLPAALALIADHHPSESRATAMSVHLMGLNLGVVGGSTLAGFLGDRMGWRAAFFVLGSVGLALAAAARVILRDGPLRNSGVAEAKASFVSGVVRLVRVPAFLLLTVQAMLVSVGTWMFFNWLPLYFAERYKMSLAEAGFSGSAIVQFAAAAGVMLGGVVSDRVSKGKTGRRLLLQAGFYVACAPMLVSFLLNPEYVVLCVCLFFYALLRGLGMSNETPAVCELLPAELRSTAVGLMNTCNTIAGGMGVFVAGAVKGDFGLAGSFSAIGVIMVVAAALLLTTNFVFLRRARVEVAV